MAWHLNSDISFCELDGRLFFLDIRNDRYFQLSEALEHNFLSYLKAPNNAAIDIGGLVRHGLISQVTPRQCTATIIGHPNQSALETPDFDGAVPFNALRDALLIVAMMRWQLKTRHLRSIIQSLVDYRNIMAPQPVKKRSEFWKLLTESAAAFNHARPYIPIETCCLIDSLSMVRFLAKRGLHANLVMGVACDPFSAHAWVQYGSLVLNETLGTAQTYVPIRVI